MSQDLLQANEIILLKKILSVRRHYDFVDPQGKKLGEADGNMVQIPPKFNVIDINGAEVMHLQGKEFSTDKTYTFYNASGEPIGTVKQNFEKGDTKFIVEKDGQQLISIRREQSHRSALESLVSLPPPDELLGPMLNYVIEAAGQTVAKFHRKWPAIRNQIKLSISGDVDHRLIIGSVIVVEHVDVEGK